MTETAAGWTAVVTLRVRDPSTLDWLERALSPEATREVPRARAELHRTLGPALELTVSAKDSGALRAALNTYLGWIHLSLATARAAERSR
jgi:tRNA threonylcarbamoyladenosine modification (KEOPS) complex  Pcc1 subunit